MIKLSYESAITAKTWANNRSHGPREYTIYRVKQSGKWVIVRAISRAHLDVLRGRMLYRPMERLYIVRRRSDIDESMAWQGYFVQENRILFPLFVAFLPGQYVPSGWE